MIESMHGASGAIVFAPLVPLPRCAFIVAASHRTLSELQILCGVAEMFDAWTFYAGALN